MEYVLNGLVHCQWNNGSWQLLGKLSDGVLYESEDQVYRAGIEKLKALCPAQVLPEKVQP